MVVFYDSLSSSLSINEEIMCSCFCSGTLNVVERIEKNLKISRKMITRLRKTLMQMENFTLCFLGFCFYLTFIVLMVDAEGLNGKSAKIYHNRANETLRFFDSFQFLDPKKWKHDITLSGGGNGEFQAFLNNRTISYVQEGMLHIKPIFSEIVLGHAVSDPYREWDIGGYTEHDSCTIKANHGCFRKVDKHGLFILNPISSARLTTYDSFSFKYGRVEVKMKLPVGKWLWPILWMLPTRSAYGAFPASGEIDIVESRGNRNYDTIVENAGAEYIQSVLHWGPNWQSNGYEITTGFSKYPNFDKIASEQEPVWGDAFHIYGMYWDEHEIYTYVDDESNKILHVNFDSFPDNGFWGHAENIFQNWWSKFGYDNPWSTPVSNQRSAPFDQEFYIIMSLAIGGTNGYFPDISHEESEDSVHQDSNQTDANKKGSNPNDPKPWKNNSPLAMKEFWDSRSLWYPSWESDNATMVVDWIKVWTLPQSTFTKMFHDLDDPNGSEHEH